MARGQVHLGKPRHVGAASGRDVAASTFLLVIIRTIRARVSRGFTDYSYWTFTFCCYFEYHSAFAMFFNFRSGCVIL